MGTLLFGSLLAHLWGDYVLQNNWMAQKKTSSTPACLAHVLTYSSCFMILLRATGAWSWEALAWIAVTHFFIDRFRLAQYWVDFFGVGAGGATLPRWWRMIRGSVVLSRKGDGPADWDQDSVSFVKVWLLIICDNTFHLTINTLALLYYLG